jgi:hypothetical protein
MVQSTSHTGAHAFWEIWDGQNVLFWTDSWKQLPPLNSMDSLCPLKKNWPHIDDLRVADLWVNDSRHPPWRTWKMLPHELNIPEDNNIQPWLNIVAQRKIHIRNGSDILRWGHSPLGTFTIREAYILQGTFTLFLLILYGKLYGSLNCGQRFPPSFGLWFKTESSPGTISKAWFYRTLYMPSLLPTGRNNRTSTKSMLYQWEDMGSSFSNNATIQPIQRQYHTNH